MMVYVQKIRFQEAWQLSKLIADRLIHIPVLARRTYCLSTA